MLSKTDETSLHRGGPFNIDYESRDITTFLFEHVLQNHPFRIISDDTEATDSGTKRCEAARNVSRATGRAGDIAMRFGPQNRNRRLRTQSFRRTSDLLIQHEVPHQDHFKGIKLLERFQKSDELVRFCAHA